MPALEQNRSIGPARLSDSDTSFWMSVSLPDIAGHCEAADGLRYGFCAGRVAVGYDDRLCTLLVESLYQRTADPLGPTGDNDDAACDVHSVSSGVDGRPPTNPVVLERAISSIRVDAL
jgi:hypothetical protein